MYNNNNDGHQQNGNSANGSRFKDISEIHAAHGEEAIIRMRNAAIDIPLPPPGQHQAQQEGSQQNGSQTPREKRIRFYSMAQLRDYQPEKDIVLAGNCNVMRGEVFVIGGEPGVGKSRAATALAIAGATGRDWLGLPVHRKFRTMIVQTENGRYRLQQECAAHRCEEMEEWVRISEPPPFGLTLTNTEFIEDIRVALEEFRPDCVILDPWNAAAKDDKQRDYSETFDALRNLLPRGGDKPALGIVAHTRKPQPNEKRTGGTGLIHILAGSYMLTSVPRSVFIMVRASEDETDDRVVWFNPKNNNGDHAPRTAWRRGSEGFTPVEDFDWEEFEDGGKSKGGNPNGAKLSDLYAIFGNDGKTMELADAAKALAAQCDMSGAFSLQRLERTWGLFHTLGAKRQDDHLQALKVNLSCMQNAWGFWVA